VLSELGQAGDFSPACLPVCLSVSIELHSEEGITLLHQWRMVQEYVNSTKAAIHDEIFYKLAACQSVFWALDHD
jgi:hypothetical protein